MPLSGAVKTHVRVSKAVLFVSTILLAIAATHHLLDAQRDSFRRELSAIANSNNNNNVVYDLPQQQQQAEVIVFTGDTEEGETVVALAETSSHHHKRLWEDGGAAAEGGEVMGRGMGDGGKMNGGAEARAEKDAKKMTAFAEEMRRAAVSRAESAERRRAAHDHNHADGAPHARSRAALRAVSSSLVGVIGVIAGFCGCAMAARLWSVTIVFSAIVHIAIAAHKLHARAHEMHEHGGHPHGFNRPALAIAAIAIPHLLLFAYSRRFVRVARAAEAELAAAAAVTIEGPVFVVGAPVGAEFVECEVVKCAA